MERSIFRAEKAFVPIQKHLDWGMGWIRIPPLGLQAGGPTTRPDLRGLGMVPKYLKLVPKYLKLALLHFFFLHFAHIVQQELDPLGEQDDDECEYEGVIDHPDYPEIEISHMDEAKCQKIENTFKTMELEPLETLREKTRHLDYFQKKVIETGLKYSLATGNWGIKTLTNKVGVAQVLNRLTYISSLSHLRRINTPIDKSGKLIPPRKLHNSTWGFLCPAEIGRAHV